MPAFFLLGKFHQKENFKFQKIKKWNEFGGCQWPNFFMFSFECVAKDIEGWLLFCTSYLVYSQFWLNVSESDCHFWLQTKILQQTTLHAPLFDFLYTPFITPQIVTLGTCLSLPLRFVPAMCSQSSWNC
jgi:hypothetical protein